MALYISTGFFQCQKLGWSESWVRDDTGNVGLETLANQDLGPTKLWGLRVKMLGQEATLTDTRTSYIDEKNDAWPLSPNYPGPTTYHSAYPALAVLWRFQNTTLNRFKNVYLRGVPDQISENGGIAQFTNPALVTWMNNANAWATEVVAGQWGWYGGKITPALTFDALGYGEWGSNPDFIEITCEANTFPIGDLNKIVTVNFSKVNDPHKSRLNGRQRVKVLSTTTCITAKPLALFPWNSSPFIINRFTPAHVRAMISQPRKIVRHDTGRPSYVPVGRQRATARG